MNRLHNLLAFGIGVLTACGWPQGALRAETQPEPVTLEAGENGLCHVHYQHVDRQAPCTKSPLSCGLSYVSRPKKHIVLRASKGVPTKRSAD